MTTANLPANPADGNAKTFVHVDGTGNTWFVISYMDGVQIRYKYIKLNDSTTYDAASIPWVNATSLPT